MNVPNVVALAHEPGLLSEGPRWHQERGELLWVDILGRQVHRGTLATDGSLDRVVTIAVDRHVGAVAPAAGGGYVLAAGPGFLFVAEDGLFGDLAHPGVGRSDVRINKGTCNPQGRFWAGTMAYDESPGAGALYRLELDGTCTTVLTGLTIANGIGWSPDGRTMYLNDSGTGCLDAFTFDPATGALTDRRTLVRADRAEVVPDGLTVDDEGGIWVAWWGGGAVRRYDPDGSLLLSVPLPAQPARLLPRLRDRRAGRPRAALPALPRKGLEDPTSRLVFNARVAGRRSPGRDDDVAPGSSEDPSMPSDAVYAEHLGSSGPGLPRGGSCGR